MPKPIKKPASPKKKSTGRGRPSDPNLSAHSLLAEHQRLTEPDLPPAPEPIDPQAIIKAHMSALGKKGGPIGGKARMSALLSYERSDLALRAANARWAKERAKKKRAK
jgi:hypothetical protein